jgi:aspartate carbamoyltransferase catalytic subunit
LRRKTSRTSSKPGLTDPSITVTTPYRPLPRGDELPAELDDDPRIAIFRQARHGLAVRMALLCLLAGSEDGA